MGVGRGRGRLLFRIISLVAVIGIFNSFVYDEHILTDHSDLVSGIGE